MTYHILNFWNVLIHSAYYKMQFYKMKSHRIFEYIKHKFYKICDNIQTFRRKKYMQGLRARLSNYNLSLISNNCNGCIVLHDLGLQFNSQFVNLYLDADDYIRYLENLDYYNSLSPKFINHMGGGGILLVYCKI